MIQDAGFTLIILDHSRTLNKIKEGIHGHQTVHYKLTGGNARIYKKKIGFIKSKMQKWSELV